MKLYNVHVIRETMEIESALVEVLADSSDDATRKVEQLISMDEIDFCWDWDAEVEDPEIYINDVEEITDENNREKETDTDEWSGASSSNPNSLESDSTDRSTDLETRMES